MKKSLLFLLKKDYSYGNLTSKSGLLNSAKLTAEQLIKHLGVIANIEICIDGNEVDKFLHLHKPKICIIEALWVTPDKLKELVNLHKRVNFVVLIHSEIPFLANEGVAVEWIKQYHGIDNVIVGFNSYRTFSDFEQVTGGVNVHLPNIYSDVKYFYEQKELIKDIDVGCFGAIRPLKNQLVQAFAAMHFADTHNYSLNFHINHSRQEQGGESVLKNIRGLFAGTHHRIFEYPWLERKTFLKLISEMHIGLQVSFTESFNIIAADFTLQGIPIVVSKDIEWMPVNTTADVVSMRDISNKIAKVINNPYTHVHASQQALRKHNKDALKVWQKFLSL